MLIFKGTLHTYKVLVYLHNHIYDISLVLQVQVETVLIESDMEAKAILDLIPILNIRKLVMGATKSNLRQVCLLVRGYDASNF